MEWVLLDSHDELATGDGKATFRNQQINQTVILENPRMLHRIERSFLDVVQIAPASIRWKRIHRYSKATFTRWLTAEALTLRFHLLSIGTTLTTDERSPPKMSPVMVDRRWVWQD
jgi:hypothetical protein